MFKNKAEHKEYLEIRDDILALTRTGDELVACKENSEKINVTEKSNPPVIRRNMDFL